MNNDIHFTATKCGNSPCTCGESRTNHDADAEGEAVDLTAEERASLARELAMVTRFTLGQLAEMRPGDLLALAETFEEAGGGDLEALSAANETDDVDLIIDGYHASEELAESDIVVGEVAGSEPAAHGSNVGDVVDDGLYIDGYHASEELAGLEGGD